MVLTRNTRFRASPHVHAREFDGELIIVDLNGGDYFGLDEIAGRVWREVVQERSAEEIVTILLKEYEVQEPRALEDVLRLLEQLVERGLVVECS